MSQASLSPPASAPPATPLAAPVVIEPKKGWIAVDWAELWEYRELLSIMVSRDLKSRYKQTIMGASWAILSPVMNMIVFTIVFGNIAKVPTGDVPKPLFFFAASVPWAIFASTVNGAANSLSSNANLIKKIYFPRLFIPLSATCSATVDFLLAALVLLAMNLSFGYVPHLGALLLPAMVLLALVTGLGVGLWLGAMMILFRDIRMLLPFFIQAWMYATPVPYMRQTMISNPDWRWVLDLNPMTPVVESFRWALLGSPSPPTANLWYSVLIALAIFTTGLFFFRRMEKTFADVA